MVLQQGREIHIRGKADPGEKITVTLADKMNSAQPDASGGWSVRLPAMPAEGPFTVVVRGKTTVVRKDVMIGEVWVASGQSNMTFALSDAVGAAEELAKADYPFLNFARLILFALNKAFLGRICFVGLRNFRRPSLIDFQGWVASQTICSVMAGHAH
jgi:hypothetical protein